MKDFLYWWLIVCVMGTLAYITHSMGWLIPVFTNDLTYITFLITGVSILTGVMLISFFIASDKPLDFAVRI